MKVSVVSVFRNIGLVIAAMMVTHAASAGIAERAIRKNVAGIDVVVYPTAVKDVVSILGSLQVGGGLVAGQNPVVAEVTGSLLTEGTVRQDKFAIANQLESVAASVRFQPNDPRVMVMGRALKKDLPLVIGLLAEQLRTPAFSEEEFLKTKEQIVAQLRSALDEPEVHATEALSAAIYPAGHPNRLVPVQERLAALERLTVAEVRAFHKKYYGPKGMRLVFVGDVDASLIYAQITKAFGGWSGGFEVSRSVQPPSSPAKNELSVVLPGKSSAAVLLAQRTGLREMDADALALDVGTAILGSGFSGRLMSTVRYKEGLTYGIGADLKDHTFVDGTWFVFSSFNPALLDKGVASIRREVQRWWQDGVTAEELAARKASMIGRYQTAFGNTFSIAGQIVETLDRGRGLDWLDQYPKAIQALTLEQVNGAIRKHLDPKKMVLVKAGTLTEGGPAAATPAATSFDRAAAVQRLDMRLAEMDAFVARMDAEVQKLSSGGAPPPVEALQKLESKYPRPKFADLVPDARRVIQQSPSDDGALSAIRVLLLGVRGAPGGDEAAALETGKEVSPLLTRHFAKSDRIIDLGFQIAFPGRVETGAFWEAIYEGAEKPRTKAMAAIFAAQNYFEAVDKGDLPSAQATALRNRGKELANIVKTKYAAEKIGLDSFARPE